MSTLASLVCVIFAVFLAEKGDALSCQSCMHYTVASENELVQTILTATLASAMGPSDPNCPSGTSTSTCDSSDAAMGRNTSEMIPKCIFIDGVMPVKYSDPESGVAFDMTLTMLHRNCQWVNKTEPAAEDKCFTGKEAEFYFQEVEKAFQDDSITGTMTGKLCSCSTDGCNNSGGATSSATTISTNWALVFFFMTAILTWIKI